MHDGRVWIVFYRVFDDVDADNSSLFHEPEHSSRSYAIKMSSLSFYINSKRHEEPKSDREKLDDES